MSLYQLCTHFAAILLPPPLSLYVYTQVLQYSFVAHVYYIVVIDFVNGCSVYLFANDTVVCTLHASINIPTFVHRKLMKFSIYYTVP